MLSLGALLLFTPRLPQLLLPAWLLCKFSQGRCRRKLPFPFYISGPSGTGKVPLPGPHSFHLALFANELNGSWPDLPAEDKSTQAQQIRGSSWQGPLPSRDR